MSGGSQHEPELEPERDEEDEPELQPEREEEHEHVEPVEAVGGHVRSRGRAHTLTN